MTKTRIQANPVLSLNPNIERILPPNRMITEYIHEGHLEGARDDPNAIPLPLPTRF